MARCGISGVRDVETTANGFQVADPRRPLEPKVKPDAKYHGTGVGPWVVEYRGIYGDGLIYALAFLVGVLFIGYQVYRIARARHEVGLSRRNAKSRWGIVPTRLRVEQDILPTSPTKKIPPTASRALGATPIICVAISGGYSGRGGESCARDSMHRQRCSRNRVVFSNRCSVE